MRRCRKCSLQFRTPTTSEKENYSFYQRDYSQGFTTELPTPEELDGLKRNQFQGSERDYSPALRILRALGCQPGERLLDYGCSWGYGSWQLAQAGYQVAGLEISVPRCEYAKQNLSVDAYDDPKKLEGPFDIFFSSHVIEHLPSPLEFLEFADSIVRPGGWIVILAPNGSQHFRARSATEWDHLWGMLHPNFVDEVFFQHVFTDSLFMSSGEHDLTGLQQWARDPQAIQLMNLEGSELLAVTRRGIDHRASVSIMMLSTKITNQTD
ncbi:MAG TPA: class I SAM-dependent methyltransferase [Pyrinomonadaceae bacterium]|nr:class I SAM-dependent methyltransferase [Pyrinomonadaceae bacterium]